MSVDEGDAGAAYCEPAEMGQMPGGSEPVAPSIGARRSAGTDHSMTCGQDLRAVGNQRVGGEGWSIARSHCDNKKPGSWPGWNVRL